MSRFMGMTQDDWGSFLRYSGRAIIAEDWKWRWFFTRQAWRSLICILYGHGAGQAEGKSVAMGRGNLGFKGLTRWARDGTGPIR